MREIRTFAVTKKLKLKSIPARALIVRRVPQPLVIFTPLKFGEQKMRFGKIKAAFEVALLFRVTSSPIWPFLVMGRRRKRELTYATFLSFWASSLHLREAPFR